MRFILIILAVISALSIHSKEGDSISINKAVSEYLSFEKLKELKEKYKKEGNLEEQNKVKRIIAKKYFKLREYEKSNIYYQEAIHFLKTEKDTLKLIKVLRGIAGNNIKLLKKEDEIVTYLNEAKLLAIESGVIEEVTAIDITLAIYFSEQTNFIEAFKLFKKAKKRAEENNYEKLNYVIEYNLGNLYAKLEDFNEAILHYQLGYDVAFKLKNESKQVFFQEALASVYQNKGEYSKALEFYQKAVDYNIKVGNTNHTIYCYLVVSECYKKMGDSNNSNYYLELAKTKLEKLEDIFLMAYYNKLKGDQILLDNKDWQVSLSFYLKSYKQYIQLGDKVSQSLLSISISECYKKYWSVWK